jgi:hypothetical protein
MASEVEIEARLFERLAAYKYGEPSPVEYERNFAGHSWWSSKDIEPVRGIFILKELLKEHPYAEKTLCLCSPVPPQTQKAERR